MSKTPHIVIVGGGAGGLELAIRLGKKLGKQGKAKITLVDKTLTHLWKPLLHEVAAGTLDSHEDELNYITHASQKYFHFQLGELQGLNRAEREIYLAPVFNLQGEEIAAKRILHYDILIIAVGSVTNDFNIPGVKEHCFFLDSREQADHFQQQFLKNLMQAQDQKEPLKPGQLDIAIIGGGATGVELAAELHYTIRQAVNYGFDHIDPEHDIQLTLIEASPRILSALRERLSKAVTKELKSLSIDVLTSERVTQVTAQGLETASGKFIPAYLKIWAAGVQGPEFLKHLDGLEVNRLNQLIVKNTLQTTQDENIFALGDCACCLKSDGKTYVPPRAQAAHQQAKLLANSLARKLAGKSLLPYVYHDYGSLITLSRYDALGNLMGGVVSFMIEGKLARMVYISLYRQHQAVLYGYWRVMLIAISDFLTRKVKPRLKLH